MRKHEKKDGQLFLFNIIIYIRDADFTESDKLESTLSYSDVIREIRRINDNERFDLLETFCQILAASIARMSKLVERVDVRIEKPSPPIDEELDSVGAEYHLKKDDTDSSSIKTFLSLGSNMGDREANLKEAIKLLENNPDISIISTSSIYDTEPMYVQDQNSFYNIAAKISVKNKMGPFGLLGLIKGIEYYMGRKKAGARYGPRLIDIDILYYGSEKIESEILQIPHPRIAGRRFVLLPLSEIAPEIRIKDVDIKIYIEGENLSGKVELISPFDI